MAGVRSPMPVRITAAIYVSLAHSMSLPNAP